MYSETKILCSRQNAIRQIPIIQIIQMLLNLSILLFARGRECYYYILLQSKIKY